MRKTLIILLICLCIALPASFSHGQNYSSELPEMKILEKELLMIFSLERPVVIDKLIVDNTKITSKLSRASQIEIFASTLESDDEDDYISCGLFELSPDSEKITCEFESVTARYVRVRVISSWGASAAQLGEIRIGRSGAKIMGTIKDEKSQEVLKEVQLSIIGVEDTKTDETGQFSFSYLKMGTYKLVVWKSGYTPYLLKLTVDSSRNRQLEIALKSSRADLFGLLTDTDQQSLPDVEITLKDTVISTRSNSNGLYIFENLKAGTHEIVFNKNGYISETKKTFVSIGNLGRLDIEMTAGQDLDPPIPLKLSPYAYSPSDPKMIGYPTKKLYLRFNEPVERDALNILNYQIKAWQGDVATMTLSPLPENAVELNGVSLHQGDKSGHTIRFDLALSKEIKTMPFIELTVSGVSDLLGNVIPKSGLTIRNFSSSAYQLEVTSPIPLENTPDLVTPLEILPTE